MKKYIKIVLLFLLFISLFIIKSNATTDNTRMYLDSPTGINEIITNKLNISGWVMSEENIQINMYINNQFIQTLERNDKRPDVLNAIKGYGGEEKNPLPGFNYMIDLSKYTVGTYTLRLEVVNVDTLNKITQIERKFVKEYANTKAYLDSTYNNTVTTNELYIDGWIMSETDIKIKVYIDNKYVQEIERNKQRDDVLEKIKGYGTKTENPLPGFETYLNISNITDGEHRLKLEIVQAESGEKLYNIDTKFNKNEARMYLDEPTGVKTTTKKLMISGWVMSDSNIEISLYINNQFVQVLERNTKRLDVIYAIKGYGGIQKNPLPGFNYILDLSKYNAGEYTLRIEVKNIDNDRKIGQIETIFVKEHAKTKAYLDTSYNDIITTNKLHVDGWVMSETDIEIKTYIDNVYIQDIMREKQREDVLNVIKGYGTRTENSLPGFETYLDISNVSDGKHELKIDVLQAQSKEKIYTITTSFSKDESRMYLDEPTNMDRAVEELKVSGWVMSDSNIEIKAYINNELIQSLERNKEREDVIKAIKGYGGIQKNPLPGFEYVLDISKYKAGTYTLRIEVMNSNNSRKIEEISKKIVVDKPNTKIYIDSPNNNTNIFGEKLTLEGWAMSEKNIQIKLYIDNIYVQDIIRNQEREDVLNAIKECGTKKENPMPGFKTQIDMTRYKDGNHVLKLETIYEKTGEILKTKEVKISLKKYDSKMYIDEPVNNSKQGKDLIICGWLLSEYKDAQINIYMNGEKISTEIKREVREDVLNAIKGYGGREKNPTPGFKTQIDMSTYKDGTYTIKIEALNDYNQEPLIYNTTNIILKKYDGVIHLESPTMTVLNKDTLEISGWELSKAPNTELEIYFDDNKLEVTRIARKDIFTESNIQKYGDESINKTPGFTTKVEFSKYNDGNHKIKLILKNIDTGETIASALKNITKYSSIKMGIDVSSYQGSIDWQAVGKSGIEFAMIRAGFRGYGTSSDGVNGKLVEDSYFKANIQGAINNGIDVGIYFFTQAINEQEAIDEANFVLNLVKNYKITYPIAIDTEYSSHPNNQGRADGLTVEQRTKVVKAFCNTIKNAGYEPMIYANKWWLKDKLDMTQLSDYSIWLAHYTGATQDNPLEKPSDYDGNYIMWQYTSSGTVDGILGNVDMNVEYKRNTQKIQLIY